MTNDDAGDASSPTTDPSAPTVVAGAYEENPCPDGVVVARRTVTLTCGTLTVPERHGENDSDPVRLAVSVLEPRAGAAAPDPLFYLDGGPGGDGLSATDDFSELPIVDERTIVIVGQRGTPLAEPSFDCPEVEAIDEAQLSVELGTPDADAASDEALGQCFDRVSADDPALDTYDSASAADDLEAARLALGFDEWNLYGVSYGTRLALEVIRRHPDALRSVVLDSTYPPEVESVASLLDGAERAFTELQTACDADGGCAAAYPNLLDRVADLYAQLEATPAEATVDHPVTGAPTTVRWDGDRTVVAAFGALYDETLIPLIPSLLAGFEDGDFTLATQYYLDLVGSAAAQIGEGLYHAVECRERDPFADEDEVARQVAEEPAWLVAASGSQVELRSCETWAAPPADEAVSEPVRGEVPTLVLAGQFDPITPPEWGRQVAEDQDTAWYFELPSHGHGVGFGECGMALIGAFLSSPETRPDGSCVEEIPPVAWALPG